jgi:glycosyltransferase involved in cell wall biosynthesis
LRAGLEAQAAGLPNVIFPGWLGQDRIAWLLRRSSLGLAPYVPVENFHGNLTNKVVEYLSGGLPVVTSLRRGVTADLLTGEGCGAVYPVDDAGALTAIITAVLEDGDRQAQMAARAKALFDRRFHADQVYDDYASYLADVGRAG